MLLVVGLLILTIVLGIVGRIDQTEVISQHEEYCYMVEMYEQSGGENGWPPYKGEGVCP